MAIPTAIPMDTLEVMRVCMRPMVISEPLMVTLELLMVTSAVTLDIMTVAVAMMVKAAASKCGTFKSIKWILTSALAVAPSATFLANVRNPRKGEGIVSTVTSQG